MDRWHTLFDCGTDGVWDRAGSRHWLEFHQHVPHRRDTYRCRWHHAAHLLFTAQEVCEGGLMLTATHATLAITSASLLMGTADPWTLGTAAIASQLPDIDTTGSVPGRIFFPISRWLEARFPHRSATHSFLITGMVAIALLPLWYFGKSEFYWALVIGYGMGWFGDVFTKSGVAAFFPHQARLVIPANPG